MTYQDEVYLQLRSAGLSGSLNDMLASNYRTGGAVGGTLNALGMSFLHNEGYTSGTYNDRWASYARANGLPVGVTMAVGSFSPSSVFGVSDLGAWYDPSDLLTLFQDSAGTTPVTATGNPIGLMLDKRYGLALGVERIPNSNFSEGTNPFSLSVSAGTSAIVGGQLQVTAASAYSGVSMPASNLTANTWIYVEATLVAGTGRFTSGFTAEEGVLANVDRTGPYPFKGYARVRSDGYFQPTLRTSVSGQMTVWDNISVRELPGSHAVQATTTARPAYRTAPSRVDYDGIDDVLVTTFASSLGANCTIVRAVPNVGAVILTGQTIGTTYSDNQDHCGLLIINRALTPFETTRLTTFMNKKAGV